MEYLLVVRWVLIYALLSIVGFPIASVLFPRFPDRGAAFAIPLSLLVAVLVAFYVGHVAYGTPAVIAAAVALALVSLAAYRVGGAIDPRAAAESYLVFLGGFAALLLYRVYNPTIAQAGGEKFLHFGLLKSVTRADTLPPADMWYAGESIRYYFGIPVMTDLLATATATEPRYAYNLAIAGYFGLLVVTVYGLAGATTHERGHSRVRGGLLGVFFVCVAGYLATSARLLFGALPREVAVEYGHAVFGAIRHYEYEEAIVQQGSPATWGWFYDRYVVAGALQEFPLYAYVKADMHGHNVTLAWLVLAAALGYAYYRTPATERRRRRLLVLLAFPVVGGFHGVANTWSMPTVAGLAWIALTFAPAHPATLFPDPVASRLATADRGWPASEAVGTGTAAVVAAAVFAGSYALASPFLLFHTPRNEGVGVLPPRTAAAGVVLLYGGFLALFAAYLLTRRSRPASDRGDRKSAAVVGLLVAAVGTAAILLTDFDPFVLYGPVLLGAWYWLRRSDRAGYETALVVGGVGLLLSMELVYAKVYPFDPPRWNTTFKVGIQAWTLCGLAAAPIATTLLSDALETLRSRSERESSASTAAPAPRAVATVALVGVVILSSASFGALVAGTVVADDVLDAPDRYPTTDGLATHEAFRPDVMAAVHWLDDEARSDAVVVSSPGYDAYHFRSEAATFTGVPTVVGWSHVAIHRGDAAFESRPEGVAPVYTRPPQAAGTVLLEYDVDYVYVGPNERDRYDDVTQFDEYDWASTAFSNEKVTIYEIDRAALRQSLDAETAA